MIAAMGNHESFPVNVYNYDGDREQMLVGGLAEAWRSWLDEEAYQSLRENGYYSMDVEQLGNVKMIVLNTQAQNNLNFYLLRESTDPGKMFSWLQG